MQPQPGEQRAGGWVAKVNRRLHDLVGRQGGRGCFGDGGGGHPPGGGGVGQRGAPGRQIVGSFHDVGEVRGRRIAVERELRLPSHQRAGERVLWVGRVGV